MNGFTNLRKCVKCPEPGTLCGLDPSKASYCKSCFIQMVKHKFSSNIGKRRLYKDGEKRETIVVYEGDPSSAFLISLVSQGLKADAHKRLTLIPTVLVLLTVTKKETVLSVKRQIESFKEVILCRWIFVHISAVFSDLEHVSHSDSIIEDESVEKWESLLGGCKTESIREELIRLSRTLIVARIAQRLSINKVMLSDSADYLAKAAIYSLSFARGSSVSCLSGVVDKRYPGVNVIRPLREISDKEIALLNRFENSDRFVVYLGEKMDLGGGSSVQKITSEFVDNLQVEGFRATITTILSTSAKLQSVVGHKNSHRCLFCSALFQSELENERFCYACSLIVDGISEKGLIDEIFSSLPS